VSALVFALLSNSHERDRLTEQILASKRHKCLRNGKPASSNESISCAKNVPNLRTRECTFFHGQSSTAEPSIRIERKGDLDLLTY
jgi:hypothetical protein